MPTSLQHPTSTAHQVIALIAYLSWEGRGKPDGSAEDDWLRAEQEVRSSEGNKEKAPQVVRGWHVAGQ